MYCATASPVCLQWYVNPDILLVDNSMIVPFYIFNQISIVPAQSKLLSNKISSHDRILIFITTVKPRVARTIRYGNSARKWGARNGYPRGVISDFYQGWPWPHPFFRVKNKNAQQPFIRRVFINIHSNLNYIISV